MSLPPALQNKNVQILIIALAILVALGFLLFQILGSGGGAPPEAYLGTAAGPGGYPGPPGYGTGYPGPPGGYPGSTGYGPPGGPGVSGYGTDMAAGGAPVTGAGGTATPAKKAGPRPPSRTDPFKTPADRMPEEVPLAMQLPATNNLYIEERARQLVEPSTEQFVREVPDPPMRMAGALWGNRVYGVLEINGQSQVVNPGDRVGIYRVERVERDRIVLSRPGRTGRRTVEAPLVGNPALQQQFPVPDPTAPGGAPGYPGGIPGGPPGGPGGARTTS
jgi:hypothetical protein